MYHTHLNRKFSTDTTLPIATFAHSDGREQQKSDDGRAHHIETKCDKLMTKVSALRQERRALKDALANEPCRAQKRERGSGELERHMLKLARNDGVFRRLCLAIHPDKLTANDAKAGAVVMQLLSVARRCDNHR